MSELPFGIDVSRYQGKIDWDKTALYRPQVVFAGIRAAISWGYTDTWFARNWEEAVRVGILPMAYHVVYPGESAERQIDHFLKVIGEERLKPLRQGRGMPLVLDVELDHGLAPAKISQAVERCAVLVTQATGRKPIIYSRAQWVDVYITGVGNPPAWLNQYDWWLAHYNADGSEHAGPPPLPKGVERNRCVIHQTSQKGPGRAMGMESEGVDLNRWQGTLESFKAYAGIGGAAPVELSLEEKVCRLWEAHRELW